MQIAVPLVVDVPPEGDINTLEKLVTAAGRQAMTEVIQAGMREYEGQHTACPHCGGTQTRGIGTDKRVLLMGFGRVVLTPQRFRCQQCKQRFRPADGFLACLGAGNVTDSLAQASFMVGTLTSFNTAVKLLESLCGVRISPEQLRHLTEDHHRRTRA